MEVDEQVRLSGVENKLVEVEILFLINLTHLLMEKTVNCKTLALGWNHKIEETMVEAEAVVVLIALAQPGVPRTIMRPLTCVPLHV